MVFCAAAALVFVPPCVVCTGFWGVTCVWSTYYTSLLLWIGPLLVFTLCGLHLGLFSQVPSIMRPPARRFFLVVQEVSMEMYRAPVDLSQKALAPIDLFLSGEFRCRRRCGCRRLRRRAPSDRGGKHKRVAVPNRHLSPGVLCWKVHDSHVSCCFSCVVLGVSIATWPSWLTRGSLVESVVFWMMTFVR